MEEQMETSTTFCPNCQRDIADANYLVHTAHCTRKCLLCKVCKEAVAMDEIEQHLEEFHSEVTCECKLLMQRWQLDEHKKSCTKRLEKCKFCDIELFFDDLVGHVISCGARTEPCDLCNKYVLFNEKESHMLEKCPKRLDSCDFCGFTCPFDQLDKHTRFCTTILPSDEKNQISAKMSESIMKYFDTEIKICEVCNSKYPVSHSEEHDRNCSSTCLNCKKKFPRSSINFGYCKACYKTLENWRDNDKSNDTHLKQGLGKERKQEESNKMDKYVKTNVGSSMKGMTDSKCEVSERNTAGKSASNVCSDVDQTIRQQVKSNLIDRTLPESSPQCEQTAQNKSRDLSVKRKSTNKSVETSEIERSLTPSFSNLHLSEECKMESCFADEDGKQSKQTESESEKMRLSSSSEYQDYHMRNIANDKNKLKESLHGNTESCFSTVVIIECPNCSRSIILDDYSVHITECLDSSNPSFSASVIPEQEVQPIDNAPVSSNATLPPYTPVELINEQNRPKIVMAKQRSDPRDCNQYMIYDKATNRQKESINLTDNYISNQESTDNERKYGDVRTVCHSALTKERVERFKKECLQQDNAGITGDYSIQDECNNFAGKDECSNSACEDECQNYASEDGCQNYASEDGCRSSASENESENSTSEDECKNSALSSEIKDVNSYSSFGCINPVSLGEKNVNKNIPRSPLVNELERTLAKRTNNSHLSNHTEQDYSQSTADYSSEDNCTNAALFYKNKKLKACFFNDTRYDPSYHLRQRKSAADNNYQSAAVEVQEETFHNITACSANKDNMQHCSDFTKTCPPAPQPRKNVSENIPLSIDSYGIVKYSKTVESSPKLRSEVPTYRSVSKKNDENSTEISPTLYTEVSHVENSSVQREVIPSAPALEPPTTEQCLLCEEEKRLDELTQVGSTGKGPKYMCSKCFLSIPKNPNLRFDGVSGETIPTSSGAAQGNNDPLMRDGENTSAPYEEGRPVEIGICTFCDEIFPTSVLMAHEATCNKRTVECEKCGMMFFLEDKETHSQLCSKNQRLNTGAAQGNNNCQVMGENRKKTPLVMATCTFCDEVLPTDSLNRHEFSCKIQKTECEKCGMLIYRKLRRAHNLVCTKYQYPTTGDSVDVHGENVNNESILQQQQDVQFEICYYCQRSIPEEAYALHVSACVIEDEIRNKNCYQNGAAACNNKNKKPSSKSGAKPKKGVNNEGDKDKPGVMNSLKTKLEKFIKRNPRAIDEDFKSHLEEANEDFLADYPDPELPCEHCGELCPESELILHQSACAYDMHMLTTICNQPTCADDVEKDNGAELIYFPNQQNSSTKDSTKKTAGDDKVFEYKANSGKVTTDTFSQQSHRKNSSSKLDTAYKNLVEGSSPIDDDGFPRGSIDSNKPQCCNSCHCHQSGNLDQDQAPSNDNYGRNQAGKGSNSKYRENQVGTDSRAKTSQRSYPQQEDYASRAKASQRSYPQQEEYALRAKASQRSYPQPEEYDSRAKASQRSYLQQEEGRQRKVTQYADNRQTYRGINVSTSTDKSRSERRQKGQRGQDHHIQRDNADYVEQCGVDHDEDIPDFGRREREQRGQDYNIKGYNADHFQEPSRQNYDCVQGHAIGYSQEQRGHHGKSLNPGSFPCSTVVTDGEKAKQMKSKHRVRPTRATPRAWKQ